MKQARKQTKDELPKSLKKLEIVLPKACKTKGNRTDRAKGIEKEKGNSTYREDFKDFSVFKTFRAPYQSNLPNISGNRGVRQVSPSSPLTTTSRSCYKGEHGLPAASCRPKWSPQPPHTLGPSGYSIDFASKPLKPRSPPPTKKCNVLYTYPRNVLLPYTRPGQTITVWKPFPVLPPAKNGLKASDMLDLISKESYSSTYRQDYVK